MLIWWLLAGFRFWWVVLLWVCFGGFRFGFGFALGVCVVGGFCGWCCWFWRLSCILQVGTLAVCGCLIGFAVWLGCVVLVRSGDFLSFRSYVGLV